MTRISVADVHGFDKEMVRKYIGYVMGLPEKMHGFT